MSKIWIEYPKRKQVCALCTEEIARYTPSMYNPTGETGKKFVHLNCWKGLAKSKGITLEEPPF